MSISWDGGRFSDLVRSRMPSGLGLPDAFALLFDWCQERDLVRYHERRPDEPYATLFPGDSWLGPGSSIAFQVPTPDEASIRLAAWFNVHEMTQPHPLVLLARTGADGSTAALWADQHGATRVVQMGSGSGSMLCTTMGDDVTDFLCFLGIGYEEICWPEEWSSPPAARTAATPVINEPYRAWLRSFGLVTPITGADIVPRPAELGDVGSSDDFCRAIFGS